MTVDEMDSLLCDASELIKEARKWNRLEAGLHEGFQEPRDWKAYVEVRKRVLVAIDCLRNVLKGGSER